VTHITWQLLRKLAAVRTPVGPAVSLYLELDPHTTPTWREVETRATSLLRNLRAERDRFTREERRSLDEDIERLGRFVEDELDRDGVRGLTVFAAAAAKLWEVLPLSASVRDAVHADRELYLVPLVPLVPLGEAALVAVISRRRGSIYRVENGSVEELADLTDPDVPSRHDQGGWSQANYERHVDELAHRHMEVVAEAIDRRFRDEGRPDVVLVCPEEERSEVQRLLAADVAAAVIGWTSVESHAGAVAVARAVQPLLAKRSTVHEQEALDRWQAAHGLGRPTASGWPAVLEAASDARVEELLYPAQSTSTTAFRCTTCGRGLPVDQLCPVDGGSVEPVDALNVALVRTLGHGGTAVAVGDPEGLGGEDVCARLRW
jgi:peptide chain release factor subunit 1